jgi:hypothetical protein
MLKATSGEPPREFTIPADIRFHKADPVTGSAALDWTPNALRVALREGQELEGEGGLQ